MPRTLDSAVFLGWYEPGSPDWYQARGARLGGSEIAAVLGLSPWQSRFSLWHLKAGNVSPEPDNREMAWGRDLEALIARRFAREHENDGWKLRRCALYANLVRPYQCAQPDRVVHLGRGVRCGLEVKTARYADDWGAEGSDDVPVYYRCQAMWQMDTFGWPACYFAVLITGSDYREYLVEFDAEEAELMREAAVEFLASIHSGTPPDIDEHAATYRAVRELHPDIDDVEIEIDGRLATEYLLNLAHWSAAEELKRKASAQVLDAMGRARRATYNGERIAVRVPGKGGPPHLRPASNGRKRVPA